MLQALPLRKKFDDHGIKRQCAKTQKRAEDMRLLKMMPGRGLARRKHLASKLRQPMYKTRARLDAKEV